MSDEKRDRLLAVAWELFSSLGYKATTVEAIAKRAGVAKGSVYRFFATKDELLFALVEGAGEGFAKSADRQAASASGSVGRIVQSFLSEVIAYRDQYLIYRRLVLEAKAIGTPAVVEAVSRLDRRFEGELARLLGVFAERGLIPACDCEATAVAVLESYNGLVAYRDPEGSPLSEERIKSAMAALLEGGLLGMRI